MVSFKKNEQILSIRSSEKCTFFSCIIAGLLIHFPMYSERLTSPDGIHVYFNNYYDTIRDIKLGRWMNYLLAKLEHNYVLPVFSVFLNLFLLACTAMLLVTLLDIQRKRINTILTGVLLSAFPAVGDTLALYYYGSYHILSFLFAVCAVMVVIKGRTKWAVLLGSACFVISCGFYQANIGVMITLALINLLFMMLEKEHTSKDVVVITARLLCMGIVGALGYLIITKLVCLCTGMELISYAGIDQMGKVSFSELPQLIKHAIRASVSFYFGNGFYDNLSWSRTFLYFMIAFCGIVCGIYQMLRQRIIRDIWRWGGILVVLILLLVGINIMVILAPEKSTSTYMTMPSLMPIIALIAIFDMVSDEKNFAMKTVSKLSIVATAALALSFALYLNTAYTLMQMNYNRMYATAVRIMDRVEQTEGYHPRMKMMIVGTEYDGEYPLIQAGAYQSVQGTNVDLGQIFGSLDGMQWGWRSFFEHYLGITYTEISMKECEAIVATENFKNMAVFPDKNCTKVINDVMIVKLTSRFD